MRCPRCEAPFSDVLETRAGPQGLRRRRICGNGHRFSTLESVLPEGRRAVGNLAADTYRAVVLEGQDLEEHARQQGVTVKVIQKRLARALKNSQGPKEGQDV